MMSLWDCPWKSQLVDGSKRGCTASRMRCGDEVLLLEWCPQ
jgi:hypothetical protein